MARKYVVKFKGGDRKIKQRTYVSRKRAFAVASATKGKVFRKLPHKLLRV